MNFDHKLWSDAMVKAAMKKGVITPAQLILTGIESVVS